MLRAFALASVLAFTAGAAIAQPPPGDATGYGGQQPPQQGYPPPDQGYGPPPGGGGGYGAPEYGQSGGGHGWGHDPRMRALRQQMRAACATDISTYCGGAGQSGQGGRGALHQCMMANHDKFSPPCQQAIGGMMAYMHQMHGQDGGAPGADMPPPSGPQPQ